MSRRKNQQARRAELSRHQAPPATVGAAAAADPVVALLQQIVVGQQELKTGLQNLGDRVEALESRPSGLVGPDGAPIARTGEVGEGYGVQFAGNILNEPGEGIPDQYYRDQHICMVGLRTQAEVRERREKLNEAAQQENARLRAMGIIWGG